MYNYVYTLSLILFPELSDENSNHQEHTPVHVQVQVT